MAFGVLRTLLGISCLRWLAETADLAALRRLVSLRLWVDRILWPCPFGGSPDLRGCPRWGSWRQGWGWGLACAVFGVVGLLLVFWSWVVLGLGFVGFGWAVCDGYWFVTYSCLIGLCRSL